MTFLQLKQRLARRRGANDTSIQTATAARYTDELNEAQRAILRLPGMDPLRYGSITFASVQGTSLYALPTSGVARINRIMDATNRLTLQAVTLDFVRASNPDPDNNQGTSWSYAPVGYVEAHTQPSAASTLVVHSSSASDTTQTVYLEGIINGGYYRTATATLSGTGSASFSPSTSNWVQVTKCYLSAAPVGTVTLHQTSTSGTELSRIAPQQTRAQFYAVLLNPQPSAALTYTCDFLRSIPDMANDTDEPLLPADFHDLLLDGAELRELKKQDDPDRWRLVQANYQDGVRALRAFVINHPDWRPVLGQHEVGLSTLGPWFPVDTVVPYGL